MGLKGSATIPAQGDLFLAAAFALDRRALAAPRWALLRSMPRKGDRVNQAEVRRSAARSDLEARRGRPSVPLERRASTT